MKVLMRILWGIVGALLIAVGVVCLCHPSITYTALAITFGIAMLVSGIVDIVIFAKCDRFMFGAEWFLVDGILTILLSLFMLFHTGFTSLSMPFVFGMWIMFSGIDKFVYSFMLRRFGVRGWGWITALGVILTVLGFAAFLDSVLSSVAMTVLTGVMFIVQGVATIVQAIFAGRYLRR